MGWDPEEAVKAYMRRIKDHEQRYETIESSANPYVKIYNVGERLVVNNIRGYLQSRIVFFLMNVHHKKRTIWFARVSRCSVTMFDLRLLKRRLPCSLGNPRLNIRSRPTLT